jgi:drug/metabolite transporter (DMT)-like permease
VTVPVSGVAGASVRPAPLIGGGAVVVAASLFAMLGILARAAYASGMVPLTFVTWRAGIGTVGISALALMLARRGRPAQDLRTIGGRQQATLAAAVVLAFAVNVAMFIAFDRIPIALALLCFYTYPAIVATVGLVTGREQLDRPRAAALALSLVGMVGVVAGGIGDAAAKPPDGLAIGLAFAAAVSQATFFLVSRDGYPSVPTEHAMGIILLGATVLTGLVAVVVGSGEALLLPIRQPDLLPLLVLTGIAGAAIPSTLLLAGIRIIGGVRTGVLMLIEPVVAAALAALLLNEGVAPIQVAGGAAILLAALLLQRAGSPETRPELVDEDEAVAFHVPGGP